MNQFAINMEKFNSDLVDRFTNRNFRDYFVSAHTKYFNDVDITFMDDFLEMSTNKDQFIISHDMLEKYGVINNTSTSANIKRCLDQYGLKEDEHYWVYNITQSVKQGGYSYKKKYILSAHAFKLCLMRAKNTSKYADYFILFEEVIAFYYKYLDQYNTKLINFKDIEISSKNDKINELQKQLDEIIGNTRTLINKSDKLLEKSR